jgi:hypothetical protein
VQYKHQANLLLSMNNSTPTWAANIIKPTQTGINHNKNTFCIMKSSEPPQKLKTSRFPYLGLVL